MRLAILRALRLRRGRIGIDTPRPTTPKASSTRDHVVLRLLQLPGELALAEGAMLERRLRLLEAESALADQKAAITLETRTDGVPVLDGKNAEARAAQLRQLTASERNDVADARERYEYAKLTFAALERELSALRAAARMLGGTE